MRTLLYAWLPVSVLGGAHYYAYARLIRDPAWPEPLRHAAVAALLVLFAGLLAAITLRNRVRLSRRVSTALARAGYVWLGTLFVLTTSLALVDTLGVALRLLTGPMLDPAALRLRAIVGAGLAATLVAIALAGGAGVPPVRRVAVRLARWPAASNGFSIVQLSDVHIGSSLKGAWLGRVVARVNELSPDLIVITGDLVDGSVAALRHDVAPLASLRAKHGVYFVTGNHEFYAGVEPWLRHLTELGVQVLSGRCVPIGAGDSAFDLVGIHDPSSRYYGSHYATDLAALLAQRVPSRAVIALAHQPASAPELAAAGVDLQISGHTHGGQIWPFSWLVRLNQPYVAGLHRHGDQMQIYVSRGTGYWGPPMRLLAPAEITQLVLSRNTTTQNA